MSSRTPANCPHDLRPGTTVCLHCLATERQAARERMRRTALRTVALGILTAGGTVAVTQVAVAMKERRADAMAVEAAATPAEPAAAEAAPAPSANPAGATPVVYVTPLPGGAGRAPLPPAAALRPRVGQGRSAIGDGMTAERHGDTVTVDFDTELNRTRRAEKFERIVRATLPRLYGAPAEAALAAVPEGGLVAGRDLMGDLPTRGMHLRLADGGTLSLWPTTRPGRDGPLVVTYRVVAR